MTEGAVSAQSISFIWKQMDYADRDQKASEIYTRLYLRAFVIDDGTKRVAFVSIECAMMGQLVKLHVSCVP